MVYRATVWTPEVIARLRQLAESGKSRAQAAAILGVTVHALGNVASSRKIAFRPVSPVKLSGMPAQWHQAAVRRAAAELKREIAMARREAATAPLYRGGWPE